jgi:hypothetical protein
VVADGGRGQLRRHPRFFRQHPYAHSELDGGRDHHARQLAAADDSDRE